MEAVPFTLSPKPFRRPPLTARHASLIRTTWRLVVPRADAAAEWFYHYLFHRAPELRLLFAEVDMARQHRKLLQTLALVANGADRLEYLRHVIEALGRRHAPFDATSDHYDQVGEALLWMLEQTLRDRFTNEAREAWGLAYVTVAEMMQAAADGVRAA